MCACVRGGGSHHCLLDLRLGEAGDLGTPLGQQGEGADRPLQKRRTADGVSRLRCRGQQAQAECKHRELLFNLEHTARE